MFLRIIAYYFFLFLFRLTLTDLLRMDIVGWMDDVDFCFVVKAGPQRVKREIYQKQWRGYLFYVTYIGCFYRKLFVGTIFGFVCLS